MKRTPFHEWPCSVARTVDLLGDWWTPLVIREAFLGATRFEEFQKGLSIGRNVLTQRLTRLVAEGLLERRQYQDKPRRFEYLLTEKGSDFFDVMLALLRWGDRWLDKGAGPPLLIRHKPCGHVGRAESRCPKCDQPLRWNDVDLEPGPGLTPELAAGFVATARSRRTKKPVLSVPEPDATEP
ncbi:MAG TPA: helix-turn-helix domain-containing protein [Candidatus Limnocylindrales bacterium]|nr:helix-turn-helix domain-containing protein [Candidatus Limnocylindrales bacterium]